jgi:hypothetical protein
MKKIRAVLPLVLLGGAVLAGCGTRSAPAANATGVTSHHTSPKATKATPAATPASGYVAYHNNTWAFSVSVPGDFAQLPPPTDGDGATWTSGAAKIVAYGQYDAVVPSSTVSSTLQQLMATDHPSYHARGTDWLVVSGTSGGTIYYTKMFLGPTKQYVLQITYPATEQAQWQGMVTTVANSFIPGPLTRSDASAPGWTTTTIKVGSTVYAVRIPVSARGIDVPATTYHGEIYWVEPPVMSEGPGPNLNPGIPGGPFTVYRASVPVQGAVLNPDAATLVGSVPFTVPALLAHGGYYNFPDNILVTAGTAIVEAAARGTGMNQPVSDPVYLIEPGHAAQLLVQLHDTGGDFSEIAAADGVVAWESGTDAIVPTGSFSFEGFVYHLGTGVTQSVSLPNPNGIPPLQITHGSVAFGTKAVSLTQPVSPAWPTAPAVALPKGASLPAYWPVQTPSERSQATTSVTGLTVSISGVGPNHTEVPNLQLKEGSSAATPTSVAVQGQTEEIHGVAVTIDSRAATWQEGHFHYVVHFTHRGSAWSLSAVVAYVMQELPPTGNPVGAWASGTCQITVSARYGIGGPNSSCLIHFQNHAGLPVTIWSRSISEAFDTAESLLS